MEHSRHLPDWEEYRAMSREEKAAAQLQSNPWSRCMIFDSFEPGNPKLRLTRLKSGEIQAEILRPESPAELRRRLEQEGFTLPDGDLWEYLCGGENGALFPWGDRLPEPKELSWRENGFGLRIGYDHEGYRREVIRDCPGAVMAESWPVMEPSRHWALWWDRLISWGGSAAAGTRTGRALKCCSWTAWTGSMISSAGFCCWDSGRAVSI